MSTNISKKKRDDLLDKIKQIRVFIAAAPQDENTGNLLSYLSELEKDVNGKKYGLVFEEHREEIDEVLDTHTPVLTEKADLFIDHGGQMNFLIEGDNLASLKLLEKTHKGKIDLIYIDPPYNTGNKDFIYDDAFVDKNDCFTHSKWLSFMEERLKTARRLLNGNGVIFISIDDREEAGLRLLCDEIFGENCFVSNISWQRNYSARNDSKGIVTEVEHLLVYSRSEEWSPKKLPRTAEMDAKYKNPDNDFAMWRTDNAYAPGASTHQGMVYAIQHPFTGEMLYPANGRCWTFGQDQMLEIMRGWCAYELRELDDAHKRAAVCGVKENEVRQGVQAMDSERTNFVEHIQNAIDNGLTFTIIVDESHQNDTIKADDILALFNANKIIRCSATPKNYKNALLIEIPEEDVIAEGLIKKLLIINENFEQHISVEDQISYLLDKALEKQRDLRAAYAKKDSGVNPLIIVQLPNKSDALLDRVEEYFESKGITYENNLLSVWLSDKKQNLEDIEDNDATPIAVIIKQAVATGWDCPRAQILVKLRDNMSEVFEIQTIGRIRGCRKQSIMAKTF